MKGKYEALFIFKPVAQDDQLQGVIDKALASITGKDGTITKSEPWGRRVLAYPIKKEKEGVYYYVEFEVEKGSVAELRRDCSLNPDILRVMIIARK